MRTETSVQDLHHPPATRALTASEISTRQANALVAAASAVAAPQHPVPQPNTNQAALQQQRATRPTPSPRSKSVSVSHFRNNNKYSSGPPNNATSTSANTAMNPKLTRQVLSADSVASGSGSGGEKGKDKKGGFLGILGKKSGGSGGIMGREKSPKRILENGVLGKDGARVVVVE